MIDYHLLPHPFDPVENSCYRHKAMPGDKDTQIAGDRKATDGESVVNVTQSTRNHR